MTSLLLEKGLPLLTKTASNNPYAVTGKWILTTAGLVVGMIHVGGLTRLTRSGLSMTDWSITGSLPPMSVEEWEKEFDRYKTYPEWEQRKGMTLEEFKYIYAWEYGHRMLGRVVGVVFCGPWLYFTVRKKIPTGFQGRMALLAAMGATQGLVGWWMVKSGLGEDRRGDRNEIRVKPHRLASHLSMAMATYGALLWTGLDLLNQPHQAKIAEYTSALSKEALMKAARIRRGSLALAGLTFATIVSGALVAGNDAGRAYNTFPTMDGQWIPSELLELSPWHRNLTENTATVQWNHRILATTTTLHALGITIMGLSAHNAVACLTPQARKGLMAIGFATAGQFTLGVTTLLHSAPISLAAMHQIGSVIVFSCGLYTAHALRYARSGVVHGAAARAVQRLGNNVPKAN